MVPAPLVQITNWQLKINVNVKKSFAILVKEYPLMVTAKNAHNLQNHHQTLKPAFTIFVKLDKF